MDAAASRSDDWPHTSRLMPWLIAAFLAMIFLVPFDSMRLPIPLPVDSTPDRFLLPIMAGVWICGALSMRRAIHPLPRTWITFAICLFAGVALASILANLGVLQTSGDLQPGWKNLAILFSYLAFFFLVATSLRRSELDNFGSLIVVLACLTALGTVVEYRTGFNVFREVTEKLSVGGTTIVSATEGAAPEPGARPDIIGPAQHGLAVCVMMAFALPLAIVRVLRSVGTQRLLWAIAMGLILAGGIATLRKTAFVLPTAVILVMLAYRPRQMLRIVLPLGVALILMVQLIAPGAVNDIATELSPTNLSTNSSTRGRTSDYAEVRPDILNHPLLGRGWGTYLPQENRYIDNEYIVTAITTGFAGVIAYLLVVVAIMSVANGTIRTGDPVRSGAALAASAGAFAYGIAGFLFDEFGFAQAPYLLFFSAAVVAVAAAPRAAPLLDRRRARYRVTGPSPAPLPREV